MVINHAGALSVSVIAKTGTGVFSSPEPKAPGE